MPTPSRFQVMLCALFAAHVGASCAGPASQASLSQNAAENTANLTASGTWTVSPLGDPNRCLMPMGGASDNGTPLVLGDCDGSASQAWTRNGDDNSMALTLFKTKCIDVIDGQSVNGTHLQLWDCFTVNDNQKWGFTASSLIWNGTGKCLDMTDGLISSNTNPMQIWDCFADNDNQKWKFVAIVTASSPNQTSPTQGSGDGDTVANANAISASPNTQVPPAPVYTSVDVSSMSTLNRRGVQTINSATNPALCMGVMGFPMSTAMVAGACDGSGAQQFVFDGNGRIGYPSQQTTINAVSYPKGAYCLSVGLAGRLNAGQPTLVPCNSGDAGQIFGQMGNLIVSASSKTCLGTDPNAQNPNLIGLSACTTRPGQAWLPSL